MRNELEHLAEIESYLMGTLKDRAAFERRLQNDPELQQDVRAVKDLLGSLRTQTLASEIGNVHRTHFLKRNIALATAATLLIGLLAAAAVYGFSRRTAETQKPQTPKQTVQTPTAPDNAKSTTVQTPPARINMSHKLQTTRPIKNNTTPAAPVAETVTPSLPLTQAPDSVLPSNVYSLHADRDEVVETPQGMIVSIPRGTFIYMDGKPVTGDYTLEIKEALTPVDIMRSGLSTWSGDHLLETGGMFRLTANRDGRELQVAPNPKVQMTVMVPKWQDRNDMMLFDGVPQADGSLDWVNPKPRLTGLVAVPMKDLNFYPPHFEENVAAYGYPEADKKFLDSVYLSFAARYTEKELRDLDNGKRLKGPAWSHFWMILGIYIPKKRDRWTWDDAPLNSDKKSVQRRYKNIQKVQGINPSTVLAFWRSEFDNTILATREFEQRMRVIHGTCSGNILACYTENMKKPLHYCDSLALKQAPAHLRDEFRAFLDRRDGTVMNGTVVTPALYNLLLEKQRQLDQLFQKTTAAYFAQQQKADDDFAAKLARHHQKDSARIAYNDVINTTQATRLAPPVSPVAQNNYNTFNVRRTGWHNIDVIFSIFYRRPRNSRTPAPAAAATPQQPAQQAQTTRDTVATPRVFTPVALTVADAGRYQMLEAYLIPDGKMAFIRMDKQGMAFTGKLTTGFNYRLAVVGYAGGQMYALTQPVLDMNNLTGVVLQPSTQQALNDFILNGNGRYLSANLVSEIDFQLQKLADAQRREAFESRMRFRARLEPVVFPCRAIKSDGPVVTR